jgi:hypothetical protein
MRMSTMPLWLHIHAGQRWAGPGAAQLGQLLQVKALVNGGAGPLNLQ